MLQFGLEGEQKGISWEGLRKEKKGGYLRFIEKYTPVFRARAGLTKVISFFIRLIGFKGIK
jgi:hypothetical protein